MAGRVVAEGVSSRLVAHQLALRSRGTDLVGGRECPPQLALSLPNRVVADVVVPQPALCFCQSVGYLLPISAILGNVHLSNESVTVQLPCVLAVIRIHVVVVPYIREVSARLQKPRP